VYRANVSVEPAVVAPVEQTEPGEVAGAVSRVDEGIEVTALPIAPSETKGEESAQSSVERNAVPERGPGRAHRHRGQETSPGLNDEIELLDRARAAINGGRPNEALVRLDEHSSKFSKGGLALEAQVLRVQALAAAGRSEEASRRAKRILSRSPNSVVAKRLRQYVIE
jgi:hypothetical protein